MQLIDGKRVAAEITEQVREKCAEHAKTHIPPGLAVVIVGDDPASQIYVRKKIQACQDNGINSRQIELAGDTTQQQLLDKIGQLNEDPSIHGILVQMPLPKQIDPQAVISHINPHKDVDGFHPVNTGKLMNGTDSLWPCTPNGCLDLLDHYDIKIEGANAVVIGRSNIVGKPMALMLINRRATVTVCTSRTKDLKDVCATADILVAAVGKPRMVTGEMVKEGAAVIDVGINRLDGKIVGDVDFESVSKRAGYITPVPGGVGPMTIAKLLENTLRAAQNLLGQARHD